MDGYKYAVFPVDFTEKFIEYLGKEEVRTPTEVKVVYGQSLLDFCESVEGRTCMIKLEGFEDCFEVEDDNWCVPLALIEVLD